MTRQQQISDAAQMCDITANRHDLDCFAAGAEWADSHPNWHKYPEDPPQIEGRYAIFTTDKSYITADYRNGHFVIEFHWGYVEVWDKEVVAWKELPQPPKFD